MLAIFKTLLVITFLEIINFKIENYNQFGTLSNYGHSFLKIKKNAWDIVSENHEIFNSPVKRTSGEINLSCYDWNTTYDQPFSSQISQVILIVLAIIILICIILGIVCCYYSVPKEEDFTKKENGIYYFENENRPDEFAPIYHKNAKTRRYVLTGEVPKDIEYEDQD
ncbi:putative signal peptide-containing protein-like and one transmembrane-like region [Cryptosporidium canis]|uniref:Signal peptide-containing protein-like and one transmembrane-like region n=1 Tax=Cryptosporidium canis TaxID=195482 RepID=A0ABQ8P562_9CRYT|nr:putative signal peptide-containing protein-like and one transmembrane-like region [Cryptosporidium canis]KAJ1612937.1 putative signal peptide-containing protein-like and one transmembrane-like region [Cryptosporidium canis]